MKAKSLIKSVSNLRNYNGIQTEFGTIKDNTIFRGGELSQLSAVDAEQLYTHFNVGQVIDLRMNREIKTAQDVLLDDVSYYHFNVIGDQGEESANPSEIFETLRNASSYEIMEKLYELFPTHQRPQEAYFDFFNTLLQEDTKAVYFHCTAGKDRTGYGGALLLRILGADEDTILRDYLLSNEYRRQEIEAEITHVLRDNPDLNPTQVREDVENTFGVKEGFLRASHNALLGAFDSFDEYVTSVLKLDEQKISQIRQRFLY